MHTVEEIIEQVRRLSLQDRRRLVEELEELLAKETEETSPLLTGRTLGFWHLLAPSTQTSQMCRSTSISTWLRHTPTGMTISEARLRGQRGVFALLARDDQFHERARELFLRANSERALSFVVMERLRIREAIAFDRHFRAYGRFVIL